MKQALVSFIVGVIFALGLGISGMTQPHKVIGFLDVTAWDPTLLFVMMGAVGVHGLTYPLVRKRKSPLFDSKWHIPTRKDLTPRLLIGAAVFGIGWGLGGFCPGPALTAIVSGDMRSITFFVMMLVGMLIFTKTERYLPWQD